MKNQSRKKRMYLPAHKPEVPDYKIKPEWNISGEDDTDESVVEDEDGIKLKLKHNHLREKSMTQYGNHHYW